MIQTICENCGNAKSFEDQYKGKKFKCPSCQKPVLIQPFGDQLLSDESTSPESSEVNLTEEERKVRKEKAKYAKEKREAIIRADEQIKLGIIFYIGTGALFIVSFVLEFKETKMSAFILGIFSLAAGYYFSRKGKQIRDKYEE